MYFRRIFFLTLNFYYVELSEILTVDGVYKLLFAINGELPGPPIVVYEGQTVCFRKLQNHRYIILDIKHQVMILIHSFERSVRSIKEAL